MTLSHSIFVFLAVVSSTTILYSCEAKIPNTPDYYNYKDVLWDNGNKEIKYDDNAYEVSSHIVQEEDKYDKLVEEEQRKNDQSKVNKIVREKC